MLIFIGTGPFLGFPMPVVIAFALMIAATLIVRRTALGLLIEAVGVNRSAARFAGLSSGALLLIVHTFAGLRAAIAGPDRGRRHPGCGCQQCRALAGA